MLSKLLKYEIKATARIFLPLYLALIVFAGINKLITALSARGWEAPAVISFIVYITILIGLFVMTFVMMIQRFYKNLLSDEAYLMLTLPAKSWKHIVTKLLVSMMWMIISGITALLSIFIIAFNEYSVELMINQMSEALVQFYQSYGATGYLFTFEMILFGLISLASGILIIYASIAIGHLFHQHKLLASIGAYIGLNTLSQILFVLLSLIPFRLSSYLLNDFSFFTHYVAWIGILFMGILSAGYYIITHYILSRRLNLE